MRWFLWSFGISLTLLMIVLGSAATQAARTHGPAAPAVCGDPPGPWVGAAPLPVRGLNLAAVSDGTAAYAVGGSPSEDQFARYNVAANTWTTLAALPSGAQGTTAVYLSGKIYVFGGLLRSAAVAANTRIYDIATDTWTAGAPMPDVRFEMSGGLWNGKIILVGGYASQAVGSVRAQTWEYDPAANSWSTSRASLPEAVGGAGYGISNGHLIMAGGSNTASNNRTTVFDYDIAANSWTTRAPLPSGVNVPGSAVVRGQLWVFGGGDVNAPSHGAPQAAGPAFTTSVTQIFDPTSNSWAAGPPLGQSRTYLAGTAVGDTVLALGGYTDTSLTTVEINPLPPACTPTPAASATPSATPTTCTTGMYNDVHSGDYFYQAVSYLASHTIISGYSDCTFRPYNNTTRGQMAKIVVLAFNLPIQTPAAGGHTFADTLPSDVFFPFIETAAATNIVSGYTCGGTNPQTGSAELCDGAGRPFYRPGNNVTRGQLTKIVVLGAGWPLLNPATPTFTDVGHSNVFYPFIETAVCHGIIAGYNDGTFQPINNAFRGQIAKIVYLAVTSGQTTCGAANATATATITATATGAPATGTATAGPMSTATATGVPATGTATAVSTTTATATTTATTLVVR
ncbi:MAG: S-layer homology domain-containing protein [Chloroflexota bacterium]|nr:S-layer homology domain-containing protein [Chloroflexota bacterium]